MNFKVGDIAIVTDVKVCAQFQSYIGTECTVIAVGPFFGMGLSCEAHYFIRLCDGQEVYASKYHLKRRDDGINGVVEWSECVWSPTQVTA